MELNHLDHAFLEELLGFRPRDHYWEQPIMDPNGWNLDFLDENQALSFLPNTSSSCEAFSVPAAAEQDFNNYNYCFTNNNSSDAISYSTLSEPLAHQVLDDTPPFGVQEEYYPFASMEEEEPAGFFLLGEDHDLGSFEMLQAATASSSACKLEPNHESPPLPPPPHFHIGASSLDRKNRAKNKPEGYPSKNLMAERRRRKRLNDRLSMLRSIVPKISKMDRTSILGDTIDYMKELLERINNLQQQIEDCPNQLDTLRICKDGRPSEVLVRNSPKFNVERRNDADTRVEICCAGKPGLLLSTVSKLEELGLEIQQCVISCFNDFAMQASCSQEMENKIVSSDDIKQALFRNAGYGGKCL